MIDDELQAFLRDDVFRMTTTAWDRMKSRSFSQSMSCWQRTFDRQGTNPWWTNWRTMTAGKDPLFSQSMSLGGSGLCSSKEPRARRGGGRRDGHADDPVHIPGAHHHNTIPYIFPYAIDDWMEWMDLSVINKILFRNVAKEVDQSLKLTHRK